MANQEQELEAGAVDPSLNRISLAAQPNNLHHSQQKT